MMLCRQRCPQPCMGCFRQSRHDRFVIWTRSHRPVACVRRRQQGRQREHGRRGGHLGGQQYDLLHQWAPKEGMSTAGKASLSSSVSFCYALDWGQKRGAILLAYYLGKTLPIPPHSFSVFTYFYYFCHFQFTSPDSIYTLNIPPRIRKLHNHFFYTLSLKYYFFFTFLVFFYNPKNVSRKI